MNSTQLPKNGKYGDGKQRHPELDDIQEYPPTVTTPRSPRNTEKEKEIMLKGGCHHHKKSKRRKSKRRKSKRRKSKRRKTRKR
jgi:hypothetical protein